MEICVRSQCFKSLSSTSITTTPYTILTTRLRPHRRDRAAIGSVTAGRHFSRNFSATRQHRADFTHAVIGGGAIGLAVARHLSIQHPNTSTLLLERHHLIGSETSSRNSEVIHAGLYYGPSSLKTRLCIRGRDLLYNYCEKRRIGFRNTRKWILAQDEAQLKALHGIVEGAKQIEEAGVGRVPLRWVSEREMHEREPDVRARAGVLESECTGIVDSHSFMQAMEGEFIESGGTEVLGTELTRVEKLPSGEWRLWTRPTSTPPRTHDETPITASILINSAGLHAIPLSNSILPASHHITPHYAKGTYFSYSSPHPRPRTLLYPAPQPGLGGLGTHLTLDLTGRIRFGPDVEWLPATTSPADLLNPAIYTPSPARLADAINVIREYLPSIDADAVQVDYCGIRPKMSAGASGTAGKGFVDFVVRKEEGEAAGLVNLLGMESPGLTASLAVGEEVGRLIYG